MSAADVLRRHWQSPVTMPEGVTYYSACVCGWLDATGPSIAQHQEDMLQAAGLLADPDALARAKAEALREAADGFDDEQAAAWIGRVLRRSADRIDPTEGSALCGDYPAPCNCDNPTIHNGHRSDR